MSDEAPAEPLSRRQRWVLTILIVAMVIIGSADVIEDLFDGAAKGHVAVEGVGIFLGIIAVAWVWTQKQRLEAGGARLLGKLHAAHAETEAWRARTQQLTQGLGRAIDDQLDLWMLSAAEKEVALLLLKGLSLKEISDARGTAERTTRQQAQEVYRKSKLAGRAELAAFFLEDLLLPTRPTSPVAHGADGDLASTTKGKTARSDR